MQYRDYSELLTVPRVARELGVSNSTLRVWIAAGKLRVVELPGGQVRVRREDLDKIMQPRKHKPRPQTGGLLRRTLADVQATKAKP